MEIAIFGTSANPPTIAHQEILAYLNQRYDVVLVYASNNPFKTNQLDLHHRNQMLQLLIDELDPTQASHLKLAPEITDLRTINTIANIRSQWGEEPALTIVIGSDLSQQIFTWYQAKALWQQVKVLMIPRQGYPLENETINKISKWSLGCTVAEIEIPAFSSTEYRLQENQQVISDSVKQYIQLNNLYQNQKS